MDFFLPFFELLFEVSLPLFDLCNSVLTCFSICGLVLSLSSLCHENVLFLFFDYNLCVNINLALLDIRIFEHICV